MIRPLLSGLRDQPANGRYPIERRLQAVEPLRDVALPDRIGNPNVPFHPEGGAGDADDLRLVDEEIAECGGVSDRAPRARDPLAQIRERVEGPLGRREDDAGNAGETL